ncbi:glycosyltransferase family 2 protein [Pseudonocardia abyssalis]|uniref:glycosyltransferase family 2 protein n=2 Tax=Pseudonocardia abyssalis TaxID=2792008 RepID=UPI001C4A6698|nr:cellulose synthase catalytic subunit [Pseudonocardia abyssalis]
MHDSPTIGPETGAFAVRDFSQLSGEITEAGPGYRVRFRGVHASSGRRSWLVSLLIITLNVAFEAAFVYWLLQPSHTPDIDTTRPWTVAANVFVIASIALVEGLRLVNVFSLSLASMLARDPIPVRPDPRLRVAFLTTIVPGKEPLEMVRATVHAARRIRHDGVFHVWLLDEGDDPAVKEMCRAEGVRHFTRRGIPEYNQPTGHFKAKTKHGNYNAWVDRYGHRYEVFLSVDPDHVPLPNYAQRMLGYFRDPDVAFVVGPQCYANVDNFVTKGAESQQFPFHSVIQRAANAYESPMLVGTNNAIRIDALVCIGGFADSITEDMATGLAIHSRRNPVTGAKWKSVYTPDVVAVGEGPSSWSDYFSQQLRWSRGTFEILSGPFWKRLRRLTPGRTLHYLLITTFYPSMAAGWILGGVNAVLYLTMGVSGIVVPPQLWLALYIDATAFQLWVYIRNRRYNVSPYEEENSPGVRGMAMSVISSPIYASSLIATLLRRPAKFVVTPKSDAATRDRLITFRRHLQWTALLGVALAGSVVLGYANLEVMMWPALALLISLAPVALWWLNADVTRSVATGAEVVDAAVDADPVVLANAVRPDDLDDDPDAGDEPPRTSLRGVPIEPRKPDARKPDLRETAPRTPEPRRPDTAAAGPQPPAPWTGPAPRPPMRGPGGPVRVPLQPDHARPGLPPAPRPPMRHDPARPPARHDGPPAQREAPRPGVPVGSRPVQPRPYVEPPVRDQQAPPGGLPVVPRVAPTPRPRPDGTETRSDPT